MEEAKRLHARLLRRGERRLQPLLLRVLAAGDLRYAALLIDSYPSSPPSAPLHNRLLHALAAARHPLLLPCFARAHRLRLLTPLSFTLLLSSSSTTQRFAASGLLVESRLVFDELPHTVTRPRATRCCRRARAAGGWAMPDRNVVSWTAMVSGYAQNGRHEDAVRTFLEMWEGAGVRPNEVTVSSVLPACAAVGALALGKKMTGAKPDGITFVGVILACTHGGLVDEGKLLFNSMREEFGLKPRIEHYGCMVDLLGRAGLLKEADSLIASMPMEPDAVIWGALLGACSFHGNLELAELAVEKLMHLEPQNTANLVILSNIYASHGKWDGVAQVWKLLKEKDHKKSAGYSFIELDGRMHKFLVEDKSHPRYEMVYDTLDSITLTMKLVNLENSEVES
ncbi:unnamed protein product [Miscanthus lutarioriparius]|uniref:Pentatricopeptide repeat-containing protein n=2 Tax=Miscanthus lutarioriparius TaxID=422564 RepID=A0A811SHR7_9POAL|nr:unnamed protein product [Miscanthus lutarioriparius]